MKFARTFGRCPTCLIDLPFAQSHDGREISPRRGDATICTECGELCVFTGELGLRLMTSAELVLHPGAGELLRMQARIRAWVALHKKKPPKGAAS